MTDIKIHLEAAIAARQTKTDTAKAMGISFADLLQYAREFGLVWPIFRPRPQPLSGCAVGGRLTYRGESLTVRELAERYGAPNGLSLSVVSKRISNKWTAHDAVTIKKGQHRCTKSSRS